MEKQSEHIFTDVYDDEGFFYRGSKKVDNGNLKLIYVAKTASDNANLIDGKVHTSNNINFVVSEKFFDKNFQTIKSSLKRTIQEIFAQEYKNSDVSLFCQVEDFKLIPSIFFEKDKEFVSKCANTIKNNAKDLLEAGLTCSEWAENYINTIETTTKNKQQAIQLTKLNKEKIK